MQPRMATAVQALIDSALRGVLTRAQAKQLAGFGLEAVTLALLAASRCIAELRGSTGAGPSRAVVGADPATPSGMIPVYTKPNAPKRPGREGGKPGHPGARPATRRMHKQALYKRLGIRDRIGVPVRLVLAGRRMSTDDIHDAVPRRRKRRKPGRTSVLNLQTRTARMRNWQEDY